MNGEDLSKVKKLEMKDLEVYGNKTKVGSIKERDSSDTEKEDESSSDDSSSSDEYENLIFSDNEKPSKPNSVPDIEPNPFAEQYQELNNNPKSLPGLLSNVLPSFFKAYMLKPVAKNAQLNIGLPENLDLDLEINEIPQVGGEFTNNDTYDLFLSDSELLKRI